MKTIAQNLTQTMTSTGPLLGAKFGDARAMASISKTAADWNTYWKTGSIKNSTAAEMRALQQGIEGGEITGTLAHELATMSEGRNWGRTYGWSAADKAVNLALKVSSKAFEL